MVSDLLTVACFGVGSAMLLVSLWRTRTTKLIRARLLLMADSFWKDVIEANQHQDEQLIKLHNTIVEIAALCPAIAAGIVWVSQDESLSVEEREAVRETISRNSWVVPYLFAISLSLDRLHYMAMPWRPIRAIRAFSAWSLMTLLKTPNGALRIVVDIDRSVPRVEKMALLDTKGACEAADSFATVH